MSETTQKETSPDLALVAVAMLPPLVFLIGTAIQLGQAKTEKELAVRVAEEAVYQLSLLDEPKSRPLIDRLRLVKDPYE